MVATNAGNGRFAPHVTVGKIINDLLAKTAFVIQCVMGKTDSVRHRLGVLDILTRAAGLGFLHSLPMIIQLQGDAHHVIALFMQQGRHNRAVHPP